MDKGTKRLGFVYKLEQLTVVRAVRGGLVSLIPVLIIGAFSLILQTFPVTVTNNRKAAAVQEYKRRLRKASFLLYVSVFRKLFLNPGVAVRAAQRSVRELYDLVV